MSSKPNKRRTIHATKLNFRPSTSDANLDFRGTKPTGEPTSVKEIFTLMVLYLCKKSLFYDTYLKVMIYLGILFILSLISDVYTIPKIYFSRSDNIFNRFFVKFAWAWNLILLVPFIVFTSYIYCCGQKLRIIQHHMPRIGIATFFWWFWTTAFNVIEASYGKCGNKSYYTKGSCLQAGHLWNGFDLSGHSFILIYGSLFLIEETRCMLNWDNIKEYLRLEEHHRLTKSSVQTTNPLQNLTDEEFQELQFNYEKYTPIIRILFVLITLYQIMWDVMLICTVLYYHIMVEKFLSGICAIITWFFTYKVWFVHPRILPKLPGDGLFKYMKRSEREQIPRRKMGNVSNGAQIPTFMGRPLYSQPQDVQDELSSR